MAISPKISIIDYGVGNLHSLSKALKHFAEDVVLTDERETIRKSDAIILPGVGAFQSGMSGLRVRSLVETVKNFAQKDKPVLGICLGAQLMLGKGFEFGEHEGLGIMPGKVEHFPDLSEKEKIPQIGWNGIYARKNSSWQNTILQGTPEKANVYFVHSYILVPEKEENILALSRYGGYEFCAALKNGNVYGCQFHPEKSGRIGLEIIKNFINII